MSHLQQYTKIIKIPTLQTYFSLNLSKLKHTRNQKKILSRLNGRKYSYLLNEPELIDL